jgi:hypothetical protein
MRIWHRIKKAVDKDKEEELRRTLPKPKKQPPKPPGQIRQPRQN